MIVLGYDGSKDARAAIEHTGSLLGGQEMTVLTVWEPFLELLTRTSYGSPMAIAPIGIESIDAANQAEALAEPRRVRGWPAWSGWTRRPAQTSG
jgi:hypothetical protein